MKFSNIASVLVAGGLVQGRATKTLTQRSTETCDQYGEVTTGSYTVYQDLWGESSATSGNQCTTVDGLSGGGELSWSTSWTWAGGSSDVKSYANAGLTFTAAELSAITEIATSWSWSYSGTSIVADVSYDMFTSASCGSKTADYEIMVWLAALGGAGPISSTGEPVATPNIGGVTWELYTGPNGDTTVFSFVAESEQTDFSGDLREFFAYLIADEGMSSAQCLYDVQAGTEAFTGTDAVLTVSSYGVSVTA